MDNDQYHVELLALYGSIPDSKKTEFIDRFIANVKNPTMVHGLSVWLGWLGFDRFALGQPILGILKLITLGGFYIWWFVDLFLVGGVAREKNIALARQIQSTL